MMVRTTLRCVEDRSILELAEDLRTLSDPNRLRILCLLLRGERCVCEVERELGISQQLTSHHLNVLKEAGFLVSRKTGTSSYYAVVPERLQRVVGVMRRYLGGKCLEEKEISGDFCGAGEVLRDAGIGGEEERMRAARGRGHAKKRGEAGI